MTAGFAHVAIGVRVVVAVSMMTVRLWCGFCRDSRVSVAVIMRVVMSMIVVCVVT